MTDIQGGVRSHDGKLMRRIYCLKYRDVKTGEVFWPSFIDPRERGDFKRSNESRIEILNEWNEVQHFADAGTDTRDWEER